MQKGKAVLEEVCSRISAGESVRIWYSNQPDELCGLHWFMAQMNTGIAKRSSYPRCVARLGIYESGNVLIQSGWWVYV